jgi:pantoate--beta-alanine ligase
MLHAALLDGAALVEAGERRAAPVVAAIRARVGAEPAFVLEYADVRSAADLTRLDELAGEVVVAVAARLGRARLIDNVVVTVAADTVAVDAGVRVPDGTGPRSDP